MVIRGSVLIVQGELELGLTVALGLEAQGFSAATLGSSSELFEYLLHETPDVVILDDRLCDADGLEVCHDLRKRGVDVPVLFVSARAAVSDRVKAFDAGADGYLTRPFALEELVARLRALLRRARMA